jgi:hypothetical protein
MGEWRAKDHKAREHRACVLKTQNLVKSFARNQALSPLISRKGCREDATKIQLQDSISA